MIATPGIGGKMQTATPPRNSQGHASDAPHPSGDHMASSTRMAYIADLLLELQQMAEAEGHQTLSGLLLLAHSEALIKSR
jgi:hypothetical protein